MPYRHNKDCQLRNSILAFVYNNGHGVEKDVKRATELITQAATQGCAIALFNLAVRYQNGRGVDKNLKRALLLYQAAVYHDNNLRNNNFDALLAINPIEICNFDNAVTFYQKINDFSTIGFCYQFGLSIPRNLKLAIDNYKQAISLYKDISCYMDVANCYSKLNLVELSENEKSKMIKFYTELKQTKQAFSSSDLTSSPNPTITPEEREKLLCLAFLYENGGSHFIDGQNLYYAAYWYEKVNDILKNTSHVQKEWVLDKCKNYSTLQLYKKHVLKVFNETQLLPPSLRSSDRVFI